MRNYNKKWLLATAAGAAFSLGLSGQAFAFDEVNWVWNKTVTENVNENIEINADLDLSGKLEMEKLQVQIGDVTATSTVTGVHNNAIGGETGGGDGTVLVTVDDIFNLTTTVDDNPDPSVISPSDLGFGEDNQLQAQILGGTLDEGNDELNLQFAVQGEFEVELAPGEIAPLDAVDLPSVVSTATAMGNNQSIESSVSIQLHDAQFVVGDFNTPEEGSNIDVLARVLESAPDSGNTHLDIAGGLALAGALGLINPAEISATSTVTDILNASVDSTATAVGNNMDVTLNAFSSDDQLVIADITQFDFANVTATSAVTGIEVNNYTNFGGANMGPLAEAQIPLVSSVATAVGNNMSIKVNAPAPVVAP